MIKKVLIGLAVLLLHFFAHGQSIKQEIEALRKELDFKNISLDSDSVLMKSKRLIELAMAVSDSDGIGVGYWRIGNVWGERAVDYLAVENWSKALNYFEKRSSKQHDYNFISAQIHSSLIYIDETDAAIVQIKRLMIKARREQDNAALAECYLNLGNAYFTKEPAIAKGYLDTAMVLYKKIGSQNGYCTALSLFGEILVNEGAKGDHPIFVKMEEAYKSLQKENDFSRLKYFSNIFALNQIANGKKDGAERYIRSFEYYASQQPSIYDSFLLARLRYKYDSLQGKFKSALDYAVLSNSLNEKYRVEQNIKQTSNLRSKYELKQSESKNAELFALNEINRQTIMRQQQMMILGIILAALLLVLAYLFYRYKTMRRQLEVEKMLAESEMIALRSQINPHFVQNTFDLMAQSIRNEQEEDAVDIIRHVSAHIRGVLDMSEAAIVSLEAELEYVKSYLDMQMKLYPGLFNYVIDVGDDVDTFGVEIPSMLLQPAIENCFKHGFNNMVEGGLIEITIASKADKLFIEILDNGKGQEGRARNAGSKGIKLTQDRLKLMFAKGSNKHVEIGLSDRKDGKRGSSFEIVMPLK